MKHVNRYIHSLFLALSLLFIGCEEVKVTPIEDEFTLYSRLQKPEFFSLGIPQDTIKIKENTGPIRDQIEAIFKKGFLSSGAPVSATLVGDDDVIIAKNDYESFFLGRVGFAKVRLLADNTRDYQRYDSTMERFVLLTNDLNELRFTIQEDSLGIFSTFDDSQAFIYKDTIGTHTVEVMENGNRIIKNDFDPKPHYKLHTGIYWDDAYIASISNFNNPDIMNILADSHRELVYIPSTNELTTTTQRHTLKVDKDMQTILQVIWTYGVVHNVPREILPQKLAKFFADKTYFADPHFDELRETLVENLVILLNESDNLEVDKKRVGFVVVEKHYETRIN